MRGRLLAPLIGAIGGGLAVLLSLAAFPAFPAAGPAVALVEATGLVGQASAASPSQAQPEDAGEDEGLTLPPAPHLPALPSSEPAATMSTLEGDAPDPGGEAGGLEPGTSQGSRTKLPDNSLDPKCEGKSDQEKREACQIAQEHKQRLADCKEEDDRDKRARCEEKADAKRDRAEEKHEQTFG